MKQSADHIRWHVGKLLWSLTYWWWPSTVCKKTMILTSSKIGWLRNPFENPFLIPLYRGTFVRCYNLRDSNIVDISVAHFKLSLSGLILNSQYKWRKRCQQYLCKLFSYFIVRTFDFGKYRWLVHPNRISCHELFNISSGQGMNCRKFGFRHLDLILKLKGGS